MIHTIEAAKARVSEPAGIGCRDRLAMIGIMLLVMLTGCMNDALPAGEYQPRSQFLAQGDASAGRKAFVDLKCNVCHQVAGEDFEIRVPKDFAPVLGATEGRKSPQEIAEFVITPSHTISEKTGRWQDNTMSGMGDYSNVITVRQLVDVVAYIRALSGEERSKDAGLRDSNK
jgi:hypothetical protein